MIMNRRFGTLARAAALMTVATITVAGCTATTTVTVPATSTQSTPAGTQAAAAGSAPASPAAQPTGPQNLVATQVLKNQLLAIFLSAKAFPAGSVTGPDAGSVYYGFVPATGTYWAMATFSPVLNAPQQVNVGMQDGGNRGIYTHQAGQAWTMKNGGIPFPCPGDLPQSVISMWALTYSPACGS